MKQLIVIFLSVFTSQVIAQKQIQKQINGFELTTILITGNMMSKIEVSTSKSDKINAILNVEGENNEHVLLEVYSEKKTLFISSKYQPLFTPVDDKSSAHKQISIELALVIPENLDLNINSDIAAVFLSGKFKNTLIELMNGNLKATSLSSNLVVNTINGNVSIESNNAKLELFTKNGEISQEKLDKGIKQITVNSIHGDIRIIKTQ